MQQLVSVEEDILGIHSQIVTLTLNIVPKMTTVYQMKDALIKSVSTIAQDFVVATLFAQFQIIFEDVIVYKVTRVTRLCLAN